MTKSQVIELLGRPESSTREGHCYSYDLGAQSIRDAEEILVTELTDDGTLSRQWIRGGDED
jgi:hypothetical protein